MTTTDSLTPTGALQIPAEMPEAHDLLEELRGVGTALIPSQVDRPSLGLVSTAIFRLVNDECRGLRSYASFMSAMTQVQRACMAYPEPERVKTVWPLLLKLAQLAYACQAKARHDLMRVVTVVAERLIRSDEPAHAAWGRQAQLSLLEMTLNPGGDPSADPSSDSLACLRLLDEIQEICRRDLMAGSHTSLMTFLSALYDTEVRTAVELLRVFRSEHPFFDPEYWQDPANTGERI